MIRNQKRYTKITELPSAARIRQLASRFFRFSLIVMAISFATPLLGQEAPARYEGVGRSMGVEFRIVLYANPGNKPVAADAMKRAFARIDELNATFSDYDPDSEVSRASARSGTGEFIKTSDDLWHLLTVTRQIHRQTDGAFDVTIGPLSQLWKEAIKAKSLPDAQKLKTALSVSGLQHIEFDDETKSIQLLVENMRLDFGGIAKGYAADEALAILKEANFPIAFVDASGDIAIGDPPPGREGWKVQVAAIEKDELDSTILLLKNCGVATSGEQYQYLEVDGKRYSHIVNPRTGYGVIGRSSATVVAKDATTSDALASAVGVLGIESFDFLAKCKNVQALVQTESEGKVVTQKTAGFDSLLKE